MFISVYKKFHMFINVEKVMKYIRNSYVSLFTLPNSLIMTRSNKYMYNLQKNSLTHTV